MSSTKLRVLACARRILAAPPEAKWDEATRGSVQMALELRCDADAALLAEVTRGASEWSGSEAFAAWVGALERTLSVSPRENSGEAG